MKIKINSKEVNKGDTFYAIKGINHDGHDYIEEAIKAGAETIYAEHGEYSREVIIVEDVYKQLVIDLEKNYGYIFDKMNIIGVTGTNGKTTISYLLYKCLNELDLKSSYIGTIGYYVEDDKTILNNTTPDIVSIYNMLINSYEKGCKYVCMEVSSHALALRRVENIPIKIGIFTNLTKDHLDFHKTMEEYGKCKASLFRQISNDGYAIINNDDNYKNLMINSDNQNITYGFSDDSNYLISNYSCENNKSDFCLTSKDNQVYFSTSLLGKHNIYNLSAIIICLKVLGIDENKIKEIVKEIKPPIGRMDTVSYNTNTIIIDYAHTPDAVDKIINAVKEFSKGKIYSIIGCGGDRDKTKRNPMASIATTLSDYVIITNDNPRTEDPLTIINDMIHELTDKNFTVILDRKEAIKAGINLLKENDVLLILGKGHENYQIIGQEKFHHDDKEEVLSYLKRKK